jgi:tetratricopeptide (TPR) repeat protein
MPAEARNLYASGRQKLSIDKNPSAALRDFHKAIARAPNFYEAHYQCGFVYLALGDVSDAEKHFQKSLELSHGNFGEADIALGSLLIDHDEIDSGEKHIRRGLQTAPNFLMAYYYLGKLAFERNDLQEAEKCAEQARALGLSNAMAYQRHLKQKTYPAFLEDIDSYLALDATSPVAVQARHLGQHHSS